MYRTCLRCRFGLALAASLASLVCPVPVASAVARKDARSFELGLRVQARTPGVTGFRWLRNGEQLHPRDEVSLYVELDRDAYVYVLVGDEKGSSELLFPAAERGAAVLVKAHSRQRLPDDEHVFTFDAPDKESLLQVVASRRPLDQKGAETLGVRWPLWPRSTTVAAREKTASSSSQEEKTASKTPPNQPEGPKGEKPAPSPCKEPGGKAQTPICRRFRGDVQEQQLRIARQRSNGHGLAVLPFRLRLWN